jgi:hypothetical protein
MTHHSLRFPFLVFIFITFFASQVLAGTTGKIVGRVVDGSTGEPLPGANIMVENTIYGAATDLEGTFIIL